MLVRHSVIYTPMLRNAGICIQIKMLGSDIPCFLKV